MYSYKFKKNKKSKNRSKHNSLSNKKKKTKKNKRICSDNNNLLKKKRIKMSKNKWIGGENDNLLKNKSIESNKKEWTSGENDSFLKEKESTIEDGGGIFCYMPYETLDKIEKSIFKIGLATDIKKEFDSLKKYYPNGFFVMACLLNIKFKNHTEIEHYDFLIEKILQNIIKNGGEIPEGYEKGWIYSDEETIHNAFIETNKNHGGTVKLFNLTGISTDNHQKIDIKTSEKPVFVGKIVYHT